MCVSKEWRNRPPGLKWASHFNILCLEKIPIVLEKSYEMKTFVMDHHVYKEAWAPFCWEKLATAMQPNNVKDKHAVAIFKKEKRK